MDPGLDAAFRRSRYLVWLTPATWFGFTVDQPPPAGLAHAIAGAPWAHVTACNPQSRPTSDAANLAAQQALYAALRALPATRDIHPAIGLGPEGWHEPSLFVVGPETAELDRLMRRFGQLAYLHGRGEWPVKLRWL
jgi:hypothetical protein